MKKLAATGLCMLLAGCSTGESGDRVVGELASDRVELVAESNEPITEIRVAEGARVEAGEVLVVQDPTRAAARLAEAEAGLMHARGRLEELLRGPRDEQIEAARANFDAAEQDRVFLAAEFERIREIAARDLASPEALDRARRDLETANATLELRRAELAERLAGTTVEELTQAEAVVAEHAARVQVAEIDLERLELRAPVAGVADSRLFEVGERPAAGQPVMILLSGAQPHARVYVPERLRVHVAPGRKAALYIDGLDAPVSGTVRWVSNEAAFTPYEALTERDRGRLSYEAKIDIDDRTRRLPDGVPLEAEFDFAGPSQ